MLKLQKNAIVYEYIILKYKLDFLKNQCKVVIYNMQHQYTDYKHVNVQIHI